MPLGVNVHTALSEPFTCRLLPFPCTEVPTKLSRGSNCKKFGEYTWLSWSKRSTPAIPVKRTRFDGVLSASN
jgi:hypothetical protein